MEKKNKVLFQAISLARAACETAYDRSYYPVRGCCRLSNKPKPTVHFHDMVVQCLQHKDPQT